MEKISVFKRKKFGRIDPKFLSLIARVLRLINPEFSMQNHVFCVYDLCVLFLVFSSLAFLFLPILRPANGKKP